MSHQLILEIARGQFAERGYEGTTVRTIAQEAGVDSALVHHFFLTKEGLFEAAVRGALQPPDLVERAMKGPRGQVGRRTVELFFSHWDEPSAAARLGGILRSMTANDMAADAVRNFLGDQVILPLTQALGHSQPELRAAMVGSHLIGLATTRYVYRVPAIAELTAAGLAAGTGKAIQTYLTGVLA
ncbi:TetR family transcriptional regulator [Micromonospora sp. D93]|uniref:TetR/AcrR family transcriptional regulator n=1 Tax=Micromonospora sp. D93 TaxID=2824886 RepID=UPI0027DC74D3|nr:TetR family transcriptional regulator [Micromonospora sp. D93]